MPKKPGTNPKNEYVFFDVVYEDGSQRSNRRVPAELLGRTTRFEYDEQGHLTTAVRPDGRELSAQYNTLGLPIRVTKPDRTVVRYEYDERGNRTTATNPSGAVTSTFVG